MMREDSPTRNQSIKRTTEAEKQRESYKKPVNHNDIQYLDEEQVSADAPVKKLSQAEPVGPGASQIGGLGRNNQIGG